MKNEKGVAIPTLIIIIAIIIVVAIIGIKYSMKMINENQLQDLRTDMLLIQADTKKSLEEVSFHTVNLDKNKEEDLAKINEVKQENLKGIPVKGTEIEKSIPEGIEIDENCYYLDENVLKDMGVKESDSEKYGNYIVKYDFENIKVEVINTKGYEGQYTLTDLIDE